MEKRRNRKLALSRETVRRLEAHKLGGVAAGATRIPSCNTMHDNCTEITSCNPTDLSQCCF
ncbi:MAG TPA: hypothetical protein VN851_01090 [Thermoanaerobaculia bacterium]|nr:hypothetical protein [Thermoanaerobaculia bacterium]